MDAIELPSFNRDDCDSIYPATLNDSYPRDSGYYSVSYPSRSTVFTNGAIAPASACLSAAYQTPRRPSSIAQPRSDDLRRPHRRDLRSTITQLGQNLLVVLPEHR